MDLTSVFSGQQSIKTTSSWRRKLMKRFLFIRKMIPVIVTALIGFLAIRTLPTSAAENNYTFGATHSTSWVTSLANQLDSRCLDPGTVGNFYNGEQVILWDCTGQANQKWWVERFV